MTEMIDWRSVFIRYAEAVLNDDICVGDRCLRDPAWCPEWSEAERYAIALIRPEVWPDGYGIPPSESKERTS